MISAVFKCDTCGYLAELSGNDIEKAKTHTFQDYHFNNGKVCNGTFRFYTTLGTSEQYNDWKLDVIKNSTCTGCKVKDDCPQSPEMLSICQFESYEYRLRTGRYNVSGASSVDSTAPTPEPVDYNKQKLDKISKSTCTNCNFKDECKKSPGMLSLCQIESLDYRLKIGKYGGSISGSGILGELCKDVKGIIIDSVPIYVEDIKRLFIVRWDTYNLQDPKDPLKFPDTKEPVADDVILRSLLGSITIGFRPVNPETNLCQWICYDIDKHSCEGTIYEANPVDAVNEIVKLFKEWYGLSAYPEHSGSPDSFHSWTFIQPTDNDIVWKFDQAFKSRCSSELNQAICKRVEKGEGHMIKLPYNVQLKNGVRSKFLGDLHKIQSEKLPVIEALK